MFPIRRLAATGAGPASSTSRSPEPRSVHGFGSAGFKGSSQHVIAGALVHGSRALGEPRSTSWPSWRQQVHDLDMKSRVHYALSPKTIF